MASQSTSCARGTSARSVVVTYKLPMLVPRVRFPVCAFLSSRCDQGVDPGTAILPHAKKLENLGIDPSASRMLSERSTI